MVYPAHVGLIQSGITIVSHTIPPLRHFPALVLPSRGMSLKTGRFTSQGMMPLRNRAPEGDADMKKLAAVLVLAALLAPAFAKPLFAQENWDHGHGGGPNRAAHSDPHWGGDIHAFRDHDLAYWRGGHWFHGPHGGRKGWWWTVGGAWYFYPAPIYPYPNPFLPPIMAPAPAAVTYWYYCHNPRGYYPYVPVCYGPWHDVPAY